MSLVFTIKRSRVVSHDVIQNATLFFIIKVTSRSSMAGILFSLFRLATTVGVAKSGMLDVDGSKPSTRMMAADKMRHSAVVCEFVNSRLCNICEPTSRPETRLWCL